MSFHCLLVFVLVLCCASVAYTKETDSQTSHGKCEPIAIEFCKNLSYNETIMPNHMNQDNQEEAALQIHQFFPLVELQCSPDFKLFLCAMYAPVCTDLGKPLLPCKSLCESSKAGCVGLMHQFGFLWPESMECSKLPEFQGNGSCLGGTVTGEAAKTNSKLSLQSYQQPKYKPKYKHSTYTNV